MIKNKRNKASKISAPDKVFISNIKLFFFRNFSKRYMYSSLFISLCFFIPPDLSKINKSAAYGLVLS